MASTHDIEKMTDEQLLRFALETLSRELGLYGYARFLKLYRPGAGDYTRDRHQWLDGLTMDEVVADLRRTPA